MSSLLSKGLIGTEWKPSENLFPNVDFSNQLIKDEDWSNFYSERDAAKNANDRLAVIIDIGKKVAARNQYYSDKKLANSIRLKQNCELCLVQVKEKTEFIYQLT